MSVRIYKATQCHSINIMGNLLNLAFLTNPGMLCQGNHVHVYVFFININIFNCSCNCFCCSSKLYLHCILCSVSFIICVVLCAVFCLSVGCYCVMCVSWVLCLIVVSQPLGKNPFAV
jgi:hypothetical protein